MTPCPVASALEAIGNGDAEQTMIVLGDPTRNAAVIVQVFRGFGHQIDIGDVLKHRHQTCTCHLWA